MVKKLDWARIGLICAGKPKHSIYIREILNHAGFIINEIHKNGNDLTSPLPPILILAGNIDLNSTEKKMIREHVEQGATLIAIDGCSGLEDLFGVEFESPAPYTKNEISNFGEGYLVANGDHPITEGLTGNIHFFGGTPHVTKDATSLAFAYDGHNQATERNAISERIVGEGTAILFGFDLLGSVVYIQQGIAVDQDGIPAPDGSAPVNDEMLRCEDGMVLDWKFDRAPLYKDQTPLFHQPIADMLRELIIRAILYSAQRMKKVLPILWYYPRNLTALGHISCDSDGSDAEATLAMINTMRLVGVRATWCITPPGYTLDVYRNLRHLEHDIGLLYNAVEAGTWHEDRYKIQLTHITRASGGSMAASRTLDTRWERRNQLFQWCDLNDVRVEESKGPNHPGNAGFLFGTCHPFRPFGSQGTFFKCFELPFLSREPDGFLPSQSCQGLIERTARHYGVAHFVIRPGLTQNGLTQETFRKLVVVGRSLGMEWWKSSEIWQWEASRRKVKYTLRDGNEGPTLTAYAEEDMDEATLLFLAPQLASINVHGKPIHPRKIERYGFSFYGVNVSLPGRASLELGLR